MSQIFDWVNKKYIEWIGIHEGIPLVETRHKGFIDGREFRTFLDLNIAAGQTKVIKVVAPVDFVLMKQGFVINGGELKFEAVTGGTESGTFSTALPTIGANRSSFRPTPYYSSQAALTSGGTHTGGNVVELVRLKSAGNTQQSSTVGGEWEEGRFLAAGTYYLRFTAVSDLTGVYTLRWEERP